MRDWIHVQDHCAGIDAALRRGRDGEVYNAGGRRAPEPEPSCRIPALTGRDESLIRFVTDRRATTAATPSTAAKARARARKSPASNQPG